MRHTKKGSRTSFGRGLAIGIILLLLCTPPAVALHPDEGPLVQAGEGNGAGWTSVALTMEPGAQLSVEQEAQGVKAPVQAGYAIGLPGGEMVHWFIATSIDPGQEAWGSGYTDEEMPPTDRRSASLGWSPSTQTFHSRMGWTYGGEDPVQVVVLAWTGGPMDAHRWEVRGANITLNDTETGSRTFFATSDNFTGEMLDERLHAGASYPYSVRDQLYGSLTVRGDEVACSIPGTPWWLGGPANVEGPFTCARGSAGTFGWDGPEGSATYPVNVPGPHFFDGTSSGEYTFRIDAWARSGMPDDAEVLAGGADATLATFSS